MHPALILPQISPPAPACLAAGGAQPLSAQNWRLFVVRFFKKITVLTP
jgi:hypothetical protein